MIVVETANDLRETMAPWRKQGDRIVFVPTMGNLHEGHLQLMSVARQHGKKVVASIFVNPMQFDRDDDFTSYPRTLEEDLNVLRVEGVDLVFVPDKKEMYPRPLSEMSYVEVPHLGDRLEGASRPGHFRGVTTVVTRLFSLVGPDAAVFGSKDYQQLLIIRRMVDDLGMSIEIIGEPTIRETDGLAMSSRNSILSADERKIAPRLYETLQFCRSRILGQGVTLAQAEADAIRELQKAGFTPDYVGIRRQSDLMMPDERETELVIVAAAWLGKARLIDNIELSLNRAD
ncbi:MAG: pantoate--beta-alanine ligase [Acidiferrobacterales bacterium]